jgi:2-polyprenyl-6-methoxyphenol hydroxylase-like FAD-dependent oxidoreductase
MIKETNHHKTVRKDSMMEALIVGAGVAGPVTAMALQKAGIASRIVEAHPLAGDDVGSYLSVSPNGLDALDVIGALPAVRADGFAHRRNVLRGSSGRLLADIPVGQPLDDGTPSLTMKRTRLTRRLVEEARSRGIAIEGGRRLQRAVMHGDRVVATFDDGSTLAADLLIGADGVHSVVRRHIDPDAPEGRYVGLTNFGGITAARSVPSIDLEPETWQFIFGRQAFFGAQQAPNGDVVWFVNAPRAAIGRKERAGTSDETWQRWLVSLFDEDGWPAADLIRAGRLELAGDSTYDLGHVPTWHRDRMIVIGDAAHAPAPSSGQGASMAMEDGVVLAMALRDAPSVEAGFAAYEGARRERVERIVAHGARSSSAKIPGRVGRIARDTFLRVAFRYLVTERSLAWMYGHRIDWDEPLVTSGEALALG